MGMSRFYYAATLEKFKHEDTRAILGELHAQNSFASVQQTQSNAWRTEIKLLKDVLAPYAHGQIIFEYDIPRLGKRVDVILLLQGLVFTLEFKVGATEYLRADIDQVWDYAMDLKNFQEDCRERVIIPVLIATNADDHFPLASTCIYHDKVYEPVRTNAAHLHEVIQSALHRQPSSWRAAPNDLDDSRWVYARYSPTPTIIQAASYMYANHSVESITRTEASGASLQQTTEYIMQVIRDTKRCGEKAICFVTGVPGAGKTLVGLNVAIQQFQKSEQGENELAVYLSGNGPLVDVLTEALARDKKARDEAQGKKCYITAARREVRSFIQIIHHYRNDYLSILKRDEHGMVLQDGILEVDEAKYKKLGREKFEGVENVAIFDEAQRAWTKTALANWLNRRKNIADFPYSEPEFLIWSLNLRKDWAVIVCLIGGGQEINTGEAGIAEWIQAIQARFPHWHIYISPNLKDKEYDEGQVAARLRGNQRMVENAQLHLAVDMRSFRAESLSKVVHHLLDLEEAQARAEYAQIRERYPICLTRSLDRAKRWLKEHARGSERYGVVCSSQAYRLRPLAIDVRVNPDHVHWFLDDENDIRSSLYLEDVCTEFQVQGLELDWVCLVWDGDLRFSPKGWIHKEFKSRDWNNIHSPERQHYQTNAYRVLLTRARQGMVICVPEGNEEDYTRKPEYYDATYEYLKRIGFEILDE